MDDPSDIIGDCALYRGNAVEFLASMPDSHVDHVITDPPYSSQTHAGARTTRPGVGLTTVPIVTFDSITEDCFLTLCSEFVRVAKRWVILTCDWRHAAALERSGTVPVIRCGVWVKPDAAPEPDGRQFSCSIERGESGGTAAATTRSGHAQWNAETSIRRRSQ